MDSSGGLFDWDALDCVLEKMEAAAQQDASSDRKASKRCDSRESFDSDCSTAAPDESSSEESDSEKPQSSGLQALPKHEPLLPDPQVPAAAPAELAAVPAPRLPDPQEPEVVPAELAIDPAPCSGPREQRVIIFDWDDTLLPTNFLSSRPASAASALLKRQHGDIVKQTLESAAAVAHVAIVTLSRRPWVTRSAQLFMPTLNMAALLEDLDITVYYAFEHPGLSGLALGAASIRDYTVRKRNAMAKCLKAVAGEDVKLNVVSVGDAVIEQQALKEVLGDTGPAEVLANDPVCKTVKLMEQPNMEQLGSELRHIIEMLPRLAASPKAFDLYASSPAELSDRASKVLGDDEAAIAAESALPKAGEN